jgi:replicative DNA helicase
MERAKGGRKMTMNTDRQIPMAETAETHVAGAVLRNPLVLDDLRLLVQSESFTDPRAGAVFAAAVSLQTGKHPVDLTTVAAEIRRLGMLEGENVEEVVADIRAATPSAAPALYFAAQVAEASTARNYIQLCSRMEARTYDGEAVAGLIEENRKALAELAERGILETGKSAGAMVDDRYAAMTCAVEDGGADGLSTGLPELDAAIGGLKQKNLIVGAAFAKVGKTTLGLNMAGHVAIRLHRPAAFVTFEMSGEELTERMIVSETGLSVQALRRGNFSAQVRARVDAALQSIRDCRLILDDGAPSTMNGLRTRLRMLQRIHKIEFAVIDYFQLLTGDDIRARRYEQLVQISKDLKKLAQEMGIPVLVLAQLNAESQTTERVPNVGDLADCKAIARDANVVLILDRPAERFKNDDQWVTKNAGNLERATIDVAMIRAGKPQTITAHYHGDICRWVTAEQESQSRLDAVYDSAAEYQGEDGR